VQPVLSFDLRSPVGDVAWAPFSSTVFAAVTENGKVHVFDLSHTRSAAVCVQRVARKTRLTKLAFNPRHPVLLVGNDQGGVTCLKLSPNLRRTFNAGEGKGPAGRKVPPLVPMLSDF
jgi:dynein intermediate chain 1